MSLKETSNNEYIREHIICALNIKQRDVNFENLYFLIYWGTEIFCLGTHPGFRKILGHQVNTLVFNTFLRLMLIFKFVFNNLALIF